MDDIPLPGMPEPPPPRPATQPAHRVTRHRTKTHRLCDTCIFLLHRYGRDGGAYPRAVRWLVVTESKNHYVCEQHKETYFS